MKSKSSTGITRINLVRGVPACVIKIIKKVANISFHRQECLCYMLLIMTFSACKKDHSKVTVSDYGTVTGELVQLYTIDFPNQLKAKVTNYGAIVTALEVPDRNGKMEDIVLGFDSLSSYVEKTPYFGAVLGRYAGRIAKGQFSIDDKNYQVATNNGVNHLHGGIKGFDKVVWQSEIEETKDSVVLKFKYISPDGEEGFPGKLTSIVTYTFTKNEWKITYEATTDAPTVVNFTQHTYFNLSACKEDILNHELILNASKYLPIDNTSIPLGEKATVENTPFDFKNAKKIGQDIEEENDQLKLGNGYDHTFVIDGEHGKKPRFMGKLFHEKTGRTMEVYTTEPGVQVYTANFLKGQFKGKNGLVYPRRYGVCLETQHFPNSPNESSFPNVNLKSNEKYTSTTIFKF